MQNFSNFKPFKLFNRKTFPTRQAPSDNPEGACDNLKIREKFD